MRQDSELSSYGWVNANQDRRDRCRAAFETKVVDDKRSSSSVSLEFPHSWSVSASMGWVDSFVVMVGMGRKVFIKSWKQLDW
jgi:hypothetical protein